MTPPDLALSVNQKETVRCLLKAGTKRAQDLALYFVDDPGDATMLLSRSFVHWVTLSEPYVSSTRGSVLTWMPVPCRQSACFFPESLLCEISHVANDYQKFVLTSISQDADTDARTLTSNRSYTGN